MGLFCLSAAGAKPFDAAARGCCWLRRRLKQHQMARIVLALLGAALILIGNFFLSLKAIDYFGLFSSGPMVSLLADGKESLVVSEVTKPWISDFHTGESKWRTRVQCGRVHDKVRDRGAARLRLKHPLIVTL